MPKRKPQGGSRYIGDPTVRTLGDGLMAGAL